MEISVNYSQENKIRPERKDVCSQQQNRNLCDTILLKSIPYNGLGLQMSMIYTKENRCSKERMKKEKSIPIGTDGKPMTQWQIWLRRLCIVVVCYSVFLLILSAVLLVIGYTTQFADLEPVTLFDSTYKAQEISAALGISALVGGILNTVVALLGIRGAKNPNKITLFFWIIFIDALLTTWALASNIASQIFDPASIVSGLFIISLAVCAWQVRKQTGYFDQHPHAENLIEEKTE